MSFLCRVAGCSWVRWLSHLDELRVEQLLLCIKRSQQGWLGHLLRMPPGRLPIPTRDILPEEQAQAAVSTTWPQISGRR